MYNEKEIIEGCKKQNRKAQKMLYERYSSKFLGICMRYAKDRQEAEDILQDAFLKIFERIDQFNYSGAFEGWMRRIIVNTAISNYRKNLKHYHHYDIDEIKEYEEDINTEELEFTLEEMLKVIQSLSPGYRMVFNLYAIEGYAHKEIAEMLGIDIATSKSQYSRARKIIQYRLSIIRQERKNKVTA
ncbi:MAG: RNA polymerase sigma factor [Bacteroidales bacterium]|nr:RNA polymerase sigma factor [Bacteroidales bacterium]